MSKLPTEFVKASEPAPSKPRARRSRKPSLISAEPIVDPRAITLQLTDEEHAALEDARQKLVSSGLQISLEQMIHRVFADWMAPPRVAEPAAAAAPRDEDLLARVRAFVSAPLRTWRELLRVQLRSMLARAR